jgi:hypothetical protein
MMPIVLPPPPRILIFGTGAVADILIKDYLDIKKVNILAFVISMTDCDRKKNGYPIIELNEIAKYQFDYLIIASGSYDIIFKQCIEMKIPENKIVGIISEGSKKLITVCEQLNNHIQKLFNLDAQRLFFKKELPGYIISNFYIAHNLWLDNDIHINEPLKDVDIQRAIALKLVVKEIYANKVSGNVAELGVYKGDFAKIINMLFPQKILYLFDTFEGFNPIDLKYDKSKDFSIPSSTFSDTNIDLVLSKMTNRDNCKIIKGYFPESAIGIDDTFSFVSIDADLFLPIYEGLKYFYERLSHNGYIFIHDYNNAYYSGAREAVNKFCTEQCIGYVPIADFNGSVIITK